MAALESRIDELYQTPLDEFTAARNALAKTLSGADAQRVRTLTKPTVVPWAINQLYWQERGIFDRLHKSGERLRAAQIAALKGRPSDVRGATDAHRNAMADASLHALRLAGRAGLRSDPDELSRALQALSLAPALPEPPGRLTRPLQPAGFEALAGVVPAPPTAPKRLRDGRPIPRTAPQSERDTHARAAARASRAAAERREAERAAQRAEADVRKAEAALARATAVEAAMRLRWERAKQTLALARAKL